MLDPFSGSATTLVTAKKLGRQFLGFELSEDYAARGSQRVIEAQVGAPLVGSADPTRSAPATPGQTGKRARVESSSEFGIRNSDDSAEVATSSEPQASELRTPNSELPVASPSHHTELLIEAFRRACNGYSLDRVVADPKLQDELVEQCRALKLAGDAKSWNAGLFRLRKSGKLTSVPTTARTELDVGRMRAVPAGRRSGTGVVARPRYRRKPRRCALRSGPRGRVRSTGGPLRRQEEDVRVSLGRVEVAERSPRYSSPSL